MLAPRLDLIYLLPDYNIYYYENFSVHNYVLDFFRLG